MAASTTTGHEIYADRAIMGLTRQLAPLKAFSLDFSNEASQKGETIRVSLISPDAAAAWNATSNNYHRTAQTVKQVPVTFGDALIAGFGVTPTQALNFKPSFWAGKADTNTAEICDTVLGTIAALVTGTNYGDAAADKMQVTLEAFGRQVVAAVRAKAIKSKKLRVARSVLALNPDYFSALLATLDAQIYGGREAMLGGAIPGLLGFRAVVEIPQLVIPGFVCHPDAIAVAARAFVPVRNTPYEAVNEIVEPETGLTLTHVEYLHGADGSLNDSVTALVAAGVGNGSSLMRLVE